MPRIDLPLLGPGSPLLILHHAFDSSAPTKSVYIQAGLRANEQSGLLVANHLLRILAILDGESKILGMDTGNGMGKRYPLLVVRVCGGYGATRESTKQLPPTFLMNGRLIC